jgi:hypothetical protein
MADVVLVNYQDDNMRRSNKTSGGAQAKKRTTHLDLPSSTDDATNSAKVHKRKGTSKSAIAVALLCAISALGTLFYISDKVLSKKGKVGAETSSGSSKERFMAEQNRLLPPDSIYRTKVEDIYGDWQQLMQYSGSVSLVVNVACE